MIGGIVRGYYGGVVECVWVIGSVIWGCSRVCVRGSDRGYSKGCDMGV